MYGASRLTLNEAGKISFQRDYYDLWGDIFDNISRFNKIYRKFMHRKFGWEKHYGKKQKLLEVF